MNVEKKHVLMTYYWAIILCTKQSLTVKLFVLFLHKTTAHVKQKIVLDSHVNIRYTPSTALQRFKDVGENWLQS